MGRIYAIGASEEEVVELLKADKIPGLKHYKVPPDKLNDGEEAEPIWQNGVTDGTNYGFLEHSMILFWGRNDEGPILLALAEAGIDSCYVG